MLQTSPSPSLGVKILFIVWYAGSYAPAYQTVSYTEQQVPGVPMMDLREVQNMEKL